jgi:hypothetical protein
MTDQQENRPIEPSAAPAAANGFPSEEVAKASMKRRAGPGRRALSISDEIIESAAVALDGLAPPDRPATLRCAISKLASKIRDAQARGCTMNQIAERLVAEGLPASVSALRRVLRDQASSRRTRKQTGASKSA